MLACITVMVLNSIMENFPESVFQATRIIMILVAYFVMNRFSKYFRTSTLIEFWYKSDKAYTYIDEYLTGSVVPINQSLIVPIRNFQSIIKEIETIVKGSDEIKKLKKVQKKIQYRKPDDIFEAIIDCYRCSIDLQRLLNNKKYSHLKIDKYQIDIKEVITSLKEIYQLASISFQKKVPNWVKKWVTE